MIIVVCPQLTSGKRCIAFHFTTLCCAALYLLALCLNISALICALLHLALSVHGSFREHVPYSEHLHISHHLSAHGPANPVAYKHHENAVTYTAHIRACWVQVSWIYSSIVHVMITPLQGNLVENTMMYLNLWDFCYLFRGDGDYQWPSMQDAECRCRTYRKFHAIPYLFPPHSGPRKEYKFWYYVIWCEVKWNGEMFKKNM